MLAGPWSALAALLGPGACPTHRQPVLPLPLLLGPNALLLGTLGSALLLRPEGRLSGPATPPTCPPVTGRLCPAPNSQSGP